MAGAVPLGPVGYSRFDLDDISDCPAPTCLGIEDHRGRWADIGHEALTVCLIVPTLTISSVATLSMLLSVSTLLAVLGVSSITALRLPLAVVLLVLILIVAILLVLLRTWRERCRTRCESIGARLESICACATIDIHLLGLPRKVFLRCRVIFPRVEVRHFGSRMIVVWMYEYLTRER